MGINKSKNTTDASCNPSPAKDSGAFGNSSLPETFAYCHRNTPVVSKAVSTVKSSEKSNSYHHHDFWDGNAPKASDLRLNEFLFYVFQWDPHWLEDQQYNAKPPPIYDDKKVVSTSLFYSTFEDYCKAMGPLLLHEFWYVLKKDGEGPKEEEVNEKGEKKEEIRKITASLEASTLSNCRNPTDSKFTVLDMTELIEKTDGYPIRGDLVRFVWGVNEIFGYVENLEKTRCRSAFNYWTLRYRVKTRKINNFPQSRITLVTVMSIGPYLRIVRAMQDLKRSPLFTSVMQPRVEDYQLNQATVSTVKPLLTGHELNSKQLEVVARVVHTVKNREPKICLIQGPPGTGKSKVILNIICETLKKTNTKILLCAPSNRAIDEIVGNLIKVQKERGDEMDDFTIVRIGREEKMGDQVKEVSLSFYTKMSGLSMGTGVNKREAEQRLLMGADVIATTLNSCYTFQMENLFGRDNVKIPVCIVDEAAQATELGTLIPLMLGVSTLILVGDPKQLPPTVISEIAKYRGLDESLFYRAKKNFDMQNGNPILMLDTQYRMVEGIVRWPNEFFYLGTLKTGSNVAPLPFHHYRVLHHFSNQQGNDSNPGEARLVMNLVQGIVEELLKNPKYENTSIGIITPYRKQRRVIQDLLKGRWTALEAKFAPKEIAKAKKPEKETMKLVEVAMKDEREFYQTDDLIQIQCVNPNALVSKDLIENGKKKKERKERNKKRYRKREKEEDKEEVVRLHDRLKSIQVNTVDSFQGQERDIIVMSCVRSRGIGFVNDPNRLCVSLTRAKHTLLLCGNFLTFKNHTMWRMLLEDAESRRAYIKIDAESTSKKIMKHVIKEKRYES